MGPHALSFCSRGAWVCPGRAAWGDDGCVSDTVPSEPVDDNPEQTWDAGDRQRREPRDRCPGAPQSLWDLVGDGLAGQINEWRSLMQMHGYTLLADMDTVAEEKILLSALNDGLALVDHVGRYDGRSAAQSARALFEHLVNMRDVRSSAVNTAERFEEYKHVLAEEVSQRRWYLPLLGMKTRHREEKRLERMRRNAAAPVAAALGKYAGFRLGWAEGGLRSRAEKLGLETGYEGYRIMSDVLQGSGSASAGVVRDVQGAPVLRIGPDLDLAAMAYAEGLSTLSQLFEGLSLPGRVAARDLHARSADLLRGLPHVRDALRTVEEMLWPTTPPAARVAVAVVALYTSGARRWYVYDPRDETVVVAHPPTDEPDLSSGVAALEDYEPSTWGGRPVTMMFEGLRVVPREGAIAVPAAAVLVPRGSRTA